MVSVRMPSSLLEELKEVSEKNHYLDVSDTIRSILRERWLEEKDPYRSKVNEIKKQFSDITGDEKIAAMKKTLKLLEELNEL
jgi:Arc/MetJ-type ribon-helix-helix transcriptional regulator